MFPRTSVMVSSLAFLGVLRALTIDNQLTPIKNDCYERLAIGQRLSPKDVYKTSHVSTVLDCQLDCTKEKEVCKSFSFGIGVKGNSTCELSTDTVKETIDLKPIGIKSDTDFDLYIKKIGCTLVIQPPKHQSGPQYGSTNVLLQTSKPNAAYVYHQNVEFSDRPHINPAYRPKPQNTGYNDGFEHVQTLVSVSTGPQKPVLHPVHEILIGERPYNYPPFRPTTLDHPYEYGSRPGMNYNNRPQASQNYEFNRPIPNRYGSFIPRPVQYYEYSHRPFSRPDEYNDRPNSNYNPRPIRPSNDGYNSEPVSLSHYNEQHFPLLSIGDYNSKPLEPIDRPIRPPSDYNKHSSHYDIPTRPPSNYDSPMMPSSDYDRPIRPASDYYSSPSRPTGNNYDRPNRLGDYNSRPASLPSDYDDRKPTRPSNNYDRPVRPLDDYRPSDYNSRPIRPDSGTYNPASPNHHSDKPRPTPSNGYLFNNNVDRYDAGASKPSHDYERPNLEKAGKPEHKPTNNYEKTNSKPIETIPDNSLILGSTHHKKPIVTDSVGPYGESITSIITELEDGKQKKL